jgi:hypothetical protein
MGPGGIRGLRGLRGEPGFKGQQGAQGVPGTRFPGRCTPQARSRGGPPALMLSPLNAGRRGLTGPQGSYDIVDVTKKCKEIAGTLYRGVCLKANKILKHEDKTPTDCKSYIPNTNWNKNDWRDVIEIMKPPGYPGWLALPPPPSRWTRSIRTLLLASFSGVAAFDLLTVKRCSGAITLMMAIKVICMEATAATRT